MPGTKYPLRKRLKDVRLIRVWEAPKGGKRVDDDGLVRLVTERDNVVWAKPDQIIDPYCVFEGREDEIQEVRDLRGDDTREE